MYTIGLEETLDRLADALALLLGQLREHEQGKCLTPNAFRVGKIACFVSQMRERRLQMQRHGIMYAPVNILLRKVRAELVTQRRLDSVEMPDRFGSGNRFR